MILAGQIPEALSECLKACHGLLPAQYNGKSCDYEYFDDSLFDHNVKFQFSSLMSLQSRKYRKRTANGAVTVPLSVLEVRRKIVRVTLGVALKQESLPSHSPKEENLVAVIVQKVIALFEISSYSS